MIQAEDDKMDPNMQLQRDDLAFLDKFVIKKDSTWKGIFDFMMMVMSVYNIFGNAYYSAFGAPAEPVYMAIDLAVEAMFFADMIFCFCQEYMDEETYNIVSSFKKIAKHYAKKSFIFDFIAWFPVAIFLDA